MLLMSMPIANARSSEKMINGFLETEFVGGINKITLPEREDKILDRSYRVNSFDKSPFGGDRVLAVAPKGDDLEQLLIFKADGTFKTLVKRNFVRFPSFSPDGRKIAYLFGDQAQYADKTNIGWYLYVVDSDGANNKMMSSLPLQSFRPAWLPDGERLAVTTRDFKIYIINIKTGDTKKIIDFGVAPAVSHSGNKIAYLSNDIDEAMKQKLVFHQNLSTKEEAEILNEKGKRLKERLELGKYLSKHSVHIYDMSLGTIEKVSRVAWIDGTPVWSPDDVFLAYTDDGATGLDIYILDIKTRKDEKLNGKHGRVMLWGK